MSIHFFDVGSNVGQTFDDFLLKRPEYDGADVWLFEPSPRHLVSLMEKAAVLANRFKIHVCPFGLRGESSVSSFFMKDDPRGDSFEPYLASDHLTLNVDTGYTLHAFAYDAALFILRATKPGDSVILKLDCEGSEYHILTHLLNNEEALSRVKQILVEFHTIKTASPVLDYEQLHQRYGEIGKPIEQWMH